MPDAAGKTKNTYDVTPNPANANKKDVDYKSSGGELKKEIRIRWSYSQSVLNSAGCEGAHRRKLRHNSGYCRQDIDDKIRQVVVRKVCADQK
jgi:hypothetical protein